MNWNKSTVTVRWLLVHAWRNARLPFMLSILMNLSYAVVPAGTALVIGKIVEFLSRGETSWLELLVWVLALLFVHLIGQAFILNSFKEYLFQRSLEKSMDEPLMNKICRLPLRYFENAHFHDLVSRTMNPSRRVPFIIEDLLHSVGSWVNLMFLLWVIGIEFWWLCPLLVGLALFSSRYESKLGVRIRDFESKINVLEREKGYASQLLVSRGSAVEVKLFGLHPEIFSRWREWFAQIHRSRFRFDSSLLLPEIPMNGVKVALLFLSIVLLGWNMRESHSDIAAFSSTVIALLAFFQGVDKTGFYARNLGEGTAYLAEVREMMELPEQDRVETKGTRPFPTPIHQGIEFQNVTFTYPGEKDAVLKGVSFNIQPNEKIAIVGANGSGKSTLIKLLLGLYTPDEGRITIDGTTLWEFDDSALRQAMTVVFQDFVRYSLTVTENIGFGQVDAIKDINRVNEAAVMGGAASFIADYPLQYETKLGKLTPESREPSGGQWQKLAISRAMMRNAQILIFDEPTASLDPVAEAELYRHIGSMLGGKTSVLVTHRLGSVQTCDRIIVMHDGTVAETGTHAELMARHGIYREMYLAQSAWYTEGIQ